MNWLSIRLRIYQRLMIIMQLLYMHHRIRQNKPIIQYHVQKSSEEPRRALDRYRIMRELTDHALKYSVSMKHSNH